MLANFEADGFAKIANIGSLYEICHLKQAPDALLLLFASTPPPPPPGRKREAVANM